MTPSIMLALLLAPPAAIAASPDLVAPATSVSGGYRLERIDVIRQPGPAQPAQVQVSIVLPDACTVVEEVHQRRNGPQILLVVSARRAAAGACERVKAPVLELVPLRGPLESGRYVVRLEGTEGGFTLGERVALDHENGFSRLPGHMDFEQP
jgi:hypothetical protein